jgi:hypothetical protein
LKLSGSLLNTFRSRYFQPAGKAARKVPGEIQGRGVSREEKFGIRVSIVGTLVGAILISAVHRPAPTATGGGPIFFAQAPGCCLDCPKNRARIGPDVLRKKWREIVLGVMQNLGAEEDLMGLPPQ